MSIRVFGLTGGIGSGKSTVGRRFAARGLPVIDADQLARKAVEPGSDGLREIVARFGSDVLLADGQLDRNKLAALVFSDQSARQTLNAITHPRVGALAAKRTRELEQSGEPLTCYEVPLLFESQLEEALRPVVVVSAPVEAQAARTVARDGSTHEQALARIRAQLPLKEKVARADFVIDNSGSLAELLDTADAVLDAICRSLGVAVERYPRPAAAVAER